MTGNSTGHAEGKAGLVLEEQVLLVDAGTGEVYTKFIGSSFFVGQVFPRIPFPSKPQDPSQNSSL